ncbi:alpha/beta hydrolase family protein [Litorimonas sp.]|uniref:alpha/beta hydrolase family protein n=1 Tax=Litorimonas sp. TaxID=1892381 RepID=UPI003A85A981
MRLLQLLSCLFLFLLTSLTASQGKAAPPPAEAFGKLPAIYDAALSPDATKIAAVMSQDGRYYLRISEINKPDEAPKISGLGETIKPAYVKWANEEQVILSFWRSEELSGVPFRSGYLYTLNIETMEGKILVDPRTAGGASTGSRLGNSAIFRQFNNVVVDWLEDDPNHILMAYSDKDNNLTPDLRRVNVATGNDSIVHIGMKDIQRWQTDRSGRLRIAQGRKDDKEATAVLRIQDADNDYWRESDEFPGLRADTNIFGFTSDPNELIIGDYQGQDTLGLYIYDLREKSITRKIYHNDTYDASGVITSKDGGEIIGANYIADTPQTEMLDGNDTILQSMRRTFQGFTIDYVDQSQDGQTVLFKLSSPYHPGALMMVEGKDSKPVNLGAYYPDLKPDMLGEVIPVGFSARDGQRIPSYVTLPPTVTDTAQIKNLPFIILPHGGPYARDSQRFDYFSQFFASRGYAVLQMNFRGSEGFGQAFEKAGRENWIIMQEDVEDGTKWLIEKGYADPDRICIAGWSYGGYASLMGAAKNPELYQCSIAMAALTDIRAHINDQRDYRFGEQSAERFIGAGFESKDDIKANSPVKIAEDMTVPLFLAHGELDQQVNFNQFKRMKRALKDSSAEVTYMEFEDEDHYLSNEENRQDFFKGLEEFLKENLGESEFSP